MIRDIITNPDMAQDNLNISNVFIYYKKIIATRYFTVLECYQRNVEKETKTF
jgi:hypothetical protein